MDHAEKKESVNQITRMMKRSTLKKSVGIDCMPVFESIRELCAFFNSEKAKTLKKHAVLNQAEKKHMWLCDFLEEMEQRQKSVVLYCYSTSKKSYFRSPDPLNKAAGYNPYDFDYINTSPICEYVLLPETESKIAMGLAAESYVRIHRLETLVDDSCSKTGKKRVEQLRMLVRKYINEKIKAGETGWEDYAKRIQKWNKKQLCSWLGYQKEIQHKAVPEEFKDPVNLCIMTRPVVLPDGHSVDEKTFLTMQAKNIRCPLTRTVIPHNYKAPVNWNLKKLIEKFLEKQALSYDSS